MTMTPGQHLLDLGDPFLGKLVDEVIRDTFEAALRREHAAVKHISRHRRRQLTCIEPDPHIVGLLLICGDVHPNPGPPRPRATNRTTVTSAPPAQPATPATVPPPALKTCTSFKKDKTPCTQLEFAPGSQFCKEHHPNLRNGGSTCGCKTSNGNKLCGEPTIGSGVERCRHHASDDDKRRLVENGFFRSNERPAAQQPAPPAATQAIRFHRVTYERKNRDKDNIRSFAKVPQGQLCLYREMMFFLGRYADSDCSQTERTDILHRLLDTPKQRLKKAAAGPRTRSTFLHKQMAERGDFQWVEASLDPSADSDLDPAQKLEKRKQARAAELVREGHAGKAASALHQEIIPDTLTHEQKRDALRDLHPPEEGTHFISDASIAVIQVDPNILMKAVKKMCKGASAGCTGLTEELVFQLLGSETLRPAVIAILTDIINNRVDETVAYRLRSCRLIALPKADKKIRPIAIGEALLKIASQYVLLCNAEKISAHFLPLQHGVLSPGGAENIVHNIRAADTPRHHIVTIDMANAFNTPYRSVIRDLIAADWPEFAPLFNLAYAVPSDLHFFSDNQTSTILSQRGTRQGDPLGGFFFALALQPMLAEAHARFKDKVKIYAYLDDITLHGTDAAAIEDCYRFIDAWTKRIGMTIKQSKCEWFSETPPPTLPIKTATNVDGFTFRKRSTDTIRVLGALFGSTRAVSDALVKREIGRNHDMHKRIMSLGGHAAWVILNRTMVPRMGYVMRTHDADESRDVCQQFDKLTYETLAHLAQVPITETVQHCAHLPTANGGMGLTISERCAADAYLASRTHALDPDSTALGRQHTLCAARNESLQKELQAKSEPWRNHLAETSTTGTANWLSALSPHCPAFHAVVASAAARLRLNCPHSDLHGKVLCCPGCRKELAHDTFNPHVSGCTAIKRNNGSTAHADFKESLRHIFTAAGVRVDPHEPRHYKRIICPACHSLLPATERTAHTRTCTVDPTALDKAHESGPDLRVRLRDGSCIIIDVTLTTSVTTSYCKRDLRAAMDAREAVKDRNYRAMVEANGEKFYTVAATAVGVPNQDAVDVATIIAAQHDGKRITATEVLQAIIDSAIKARALSLHNAEEQMGVHHSFTFNDDKFRGAKIPLRSIGNTRADVFGPAGINAIPRPNPMPAAAPPEPAAEHPDATDNTIAPDEMPATVVPPEADSPAQRIIAEALRIVEDSPCPALSQLEYGALPPARPTTQQPQQSNKAHRRNTTDARTAVTPSPVPMQTFDSPPPATHHQCTHPPRLPRFNDALATLRKLRNTAALQELVKWIPAALTPLVHLIIPNAEHSLLHATIRFALTCLGTAQTFHSLSRAAKVIAVVTVASMAAAWVPMLVATASYYIEHHTPTVLLLAAVAILATTTACTAAILLGKAASVTSVPIRTARVTVDSIKLFMQSSVEAATVARAAAQETRTVHTPVPKPHRTSITPARLTAAARINRLNTASAIARVLLTTACIAYTVYEFATVCQPAQLDAIKARAILYFGGHQPDTPHWLQVNTSSQIWLNMHGSSIDFIQQVPFVRNVSFYDVAKISTVNAAERALTAMATSVADAPASMLNRIVVSFSQHVYPVLTAVACAIGAAALKLSRPIILA